MKTITAKYVPGDRIWRIEQIACRIVKQKCEACGSVLEDDYQIKHTVTEDMVQDVIIIWSTGEVRYKCGGWNFGDYAEGDLYATPADAEKALKGATDGD